MTPLQSTLADLTAAELYAWLKANAPQAPSITAVELDPTNSAAYIKFLNLRGAVWALYGGTDADPVYGSNQKLIDAYGEQANEWEQHDKRNGVPPPAFPQLQQLDLTDYDQWWASENLYFDVGSPLYRDDVFHAKIEGYQFYLVPAPKFPDVVILPPTAAPVLPASGNPIGAQISKFPPLFSQATTGHNLGDTFTDPKTGAKYQLINFSPMNEDPAKFDWLQQ